jgi:uncharacterized iron-regulated protein
MKNKPFNMKKLLIVVLLPLLLAFAAGDKPAYVLFTGKGEKVTYSVMLDSLMKADVIFFGELHNNAISHWMELEIAMDLFRRDSAALVMGAEMFERDNQIILDEYLSGLIRERDFEAGARLWTNHKTDYRPLINFAAEKGIPFVASNIPRRYAAMVNARGFEALDALAPEAKKWIAPLPVPYDPELPGYKAMTSMGGTAMHANNNLPKSQAIKDATMAWFISSRYEPGKRFLHFNGSYHSDNGEGIVWYLNQYVPGLKIMTISTVEQSQLEALDPSERGKADFILVVNDRVTRTY